MNLRDRVKAANQVIDILAATAGQHFHAEAYGRTGKFGLDKHEQIKYLDKSGMLLFPFGPGKWPGFTEDAAHQAAIAALAKFIKEGKKVDGRVLAFVEQTTLEAIGPELQATGVFKGEK